MKKRIIRGQNLENEIKPGQKIIIKSWKRPNQYWRGGSRLSDYLNVPFEITRVHAGLCQKMVAFTEFEIYDWDNSIYILKNGNEYPFSLLHEINEYEILE